MENMMAVVEPTHVIINEGMFPTQMEMDVPHSKEYLKYTKDGRSFDLDIIMYTVEEAAGKWPDTEFVVNKMNYPTLTYNTNAFGAAVGCFQQALNYGMPTMDKDDIVINGEVDMFHHEADKDTLAKLFHSMEGDRVALVENRRFFVSPFVRMSQGNLVVKFAKWGTGVVWPRALVLRHWGKLDRHVCIQPRLAVYHYEWIRPDTYFFHKLEQIASRGDKIEGYLEAKALIEAWGCVGGRGHILVREGDLFDAPTTDHPIHFRGHAEYLRYESISSESTNTVPDK
jgi:hypothetical protein